MSTTTRRPRRTTQRGRKRDAESLDPHPDPIAPQPTRGRRKSKSSAPDPPSTTVAAQPLQEHAHQPPQVSDSVEMPSNPINDDAPLASRGGDKTILSDPAARSLRFAPSFEEIVINEDDWSDTSGSRPTTPTPTGASSGPVRSHLHPPHTPQSTTPMHTPRTVHTPHTPRTVRTPRTPRTGPHSKQRANAAKIKAGKSQKRGADVFTYFETQNNRRHCIFCRKIKLADPEYDVINFSVTTSTSGLRRHLWEHHLSEWVDDCDKCNIKIGAKEAKVHVSRYRDQKAQRPQPVSQTSDDSHREFSHEAFVNAIIEWIVSDDQSLNVIESPQLREIFLLLRPELQNSDIPSRTTIRNRISDILETHITELKRDMQHSLGRISLTTDMWSDTNLSPFMAVTAHWIEGKTENTINGPRRVLKLRSDLIGFLRVPGHHTGEHLAHALLHITDRVGITDKIGWITVDNATNNDTLVGTLERELRRRQVKFDKIQRRIRCFPHVVNLACKAVVEALTRMEFSAVNADEYSPPEGPRPTSFIEALERDPIAIIRSLIRSASLFIFLKIRASSLRRHYFNTCLETLGHHLQLLRDVDTRWSSTLLMITRAIELRDAITMFLENDEFRDLRKFTLSNAEWDALVAFRDILQVPHAFQQLLSFESTPTLCDALPAYTAFEQQWKEYQELHPEVAPFIQRGLDKLEIYHERTELVPAYVLAMIINPSERLMWYHENEMPEKAQQAKELLLRELKEYQVQSTTPETTQEPTPTHDAHTWARGILKPRRNRTLPAHCPLETEVERYLNDQLADPTIPSLLWWQENADRYPTIFRLAMDILPIQGSAVPCERVFSSAKETMTPRRNRITAELMEALQLLKFSVKKGRHLNFTLGLNRDHELEALEMLMATESQFPEDVRSYSETFILRRKA